MTIKRIFSLLLLVASLFVGTSGAHAENSPIPAPVGDIYVQDFANLLTAQEEAELRAFGRWIEDQTTAQIAVLTVESIGETTVEEFANEAFRQYGIGSEASDNGVLLVIGTTPPPGMSDRPLRIEVGYGLEGALPDGKVGRILDEITAPYLLQDQYQAAVFETYKVLANEVLAEYGIAEGQQPIQQPPPLEQTYAGNEGPTIPTWLLIIILPIVLFLDFKYFGGTLTRLLLYILSRGGGRGGDGPRGGGGGSSGGGGASRGW